MSKVRIYDLAKELKLDNKKVIEEVRRFGYDVSVPSNSVPLEIAEKVKSKYFPQKTQADRKVKLVKHRFDEQPPSAPEVAPFQETVKREIPSLKQPIQQEVKPQEVRIPAASQIKIVKKVEPVVPPQQPEPKTTAVKVEPEEAKPRIVRIEVPREAPAVAATPVVQPPAPTVQKPAEPIVPAPQPVSPAPQPVSPAPQSTGTSVKTQIIPLQVQTLPRQPQQYQRDRSNQPPQQYQRDRSNQPPQQYQRDRSNQPPQQYQRDRSNQPPQQYQRDRSSQPPQQQGYQRSQQFSGSPEQGQPDRQAIQKLVSKPMGQSFNRPSQQPELLEVPEGQRTTYIPPPDSRKKGRRSTLPQAKATPFKKEDREKLPIRHVPSSIGPSIAPKAVPKELKPIKLVEGCTVKEFAEKLEVKPKDVVALLLGKGVMATINQTLNADVAREIGREFGYEVSFGGFEEMTAEVEFEVEPQLLEDSETRAPVVTVMGHVDHGKTSLLDAIRKTSVAEGEAGGITQHIGAYSVEVPDPDNPEHKRRVVFLDTPGHEAFTMMRARGARVTDVVVLVVAADDGVMPQTIEAIEHAKAAGVPIVVAINKIDKPQAQPDRVKQALSEYGLLWDGWGGDTVMVEVSAKQRINLDGLLEMILLTADILNLKSSPKRLGTGVVLEAKLDKGRGAVATVLIQNGTLRVGDPVIAGLFFGRVRAMFDDRGRQIQEAGPSTPVEVLGLQGVPSAGDQFQVVTDVAKAQQISLLRQSKKRILELSRSSAQRLEDLFSAMQAGKLKELLVILKADVQGSVEVLKDTLQKLSTDKVKVRVIRSGVGAITESDVLLAAASNDMAHSAVIIGFNVRPEQRAEELAKLENVDIRLHTIIYKIEEEIRAAMLGMLEATVKEVPLGKAEIRRVIKIPKIGNIAGCMVLEGVIKRTARLRLLRDGVVVYEGGVSSLKRFKEDVSEVKQGFECGIGIERYSDLKIGDIIEAFTTEKVVPTEL